MCGCQVRVCIRCDCLCLFVCLLSARVEINGANEKAEPSFGTTDADGVCVSSALCVRVMIDRVDSVSVPQMLVVTVCVSGVRD